VADWNLTHSRLLSCLSSTSWTTIVVHSRDDQEVGVAHKVKSPKNQLQFSQMMLGQYWLGKTSPNKFSDWPKMLSKSCNGIYYSMEFSDWLTRDITILIVLLHYSSLFQYFFYWPTIIPTLVELFKNFNTLVIMHLVATTFLLNQCLMYIVWSSQALSLTGS